MVMISLYAKLTEPVVLSLYNIASLAVFTHWYAIIIVHYVQVRTAVIPVAIIVHIMKIVCIHLACYNSNNNMH
jgi:hypothetical protein